jgi:thioredoxin 1
MVKDAAARGATRHEHYDSAGLERAAAANAPGSVHDDGDDQTMSNAVAVTDADFELQVEQHAGLTVVDFWATWCGPCRMIAPILDQLAAEYQGKVRVAKLDVDSNQKTTTRFNVRSIPAMLFFKDGKLVDQVIGAVPKTALAAKFAQHAA